MPSGQSTFNAKSLGP